MSNLIGNTGNVWYLVMTYLWKLKRHQNRHATFFAYDLLNPCTWIQSSPTLLASLLENRCTKWLLIVLTRPPLMTTCFQPFGVLASSTLCREICFLGFRMLVFHTEYSQFSENNKINFILYICHEESVNYFSGYQSLSNSHLCFNGVEEKDE